MQTAPGVIAPETRRSQTSSDGQHHATATITGTGTGDSDAPAEQRAAIQTTAGSNTATTSKAGARQSGRLREKGPTRYTARGEVLRGGKRVNEYKYGDV